MPVPGSREGVNGELVSVDVPAGLRGVSEPDDLVPPQSMDAAAGEEDKANVCLANEFSQGANERGRAVQGTAMANQSSFD